MVLMLPLAVFFVVLFVISFNRYIDILIDVLAQYFIFTAYYKYARLRLVQMTDSLCPTNTFAIEQS